jgi:molybdate transport system substrate-binding protein
MVFPMRVLVIALISIWSAVWIEPSRAAETVTVFAAASLKTALDDAAAAWQAKTGIEVKASYAASAALARQIESGAPADVFASADLAWMGYLAGKGLIKPGTQVNLLGNELVVVTRADSKLDQVALTQDGLTIALAGGRWTTGDVGSVPVGIYAKEALSTLGLWEALAPRLAPAENVRAALAYVSRGEAPLGIVYETDVKADPGVKIVARIPGDTHQPIIYPFALTSTARGEAPAQFLAFLASAQARPFFERQGFRLLDPRASN